MRCLFTSPGLEIGTDMIEVEMNASLMIFIDAPGPYQQ